MASPAVPRFFLFFFIRCNQRTLSASSGAVLYLLSIVLSVVSAVVRLLKQLFFRSILDCGFVRWHSVGTLAAVVGLSWPDFFLFLLTFLVGRDCYCLSVERCGERKRWSGRQNTTVRTGECSTPPTTSWISDSGR